MPQRLCGNLTFLILARQIYIGVCVSLGAPGEPKAVPWGAQELLH